MASQDPTSIPEAPQRGSSGEVTRLLQQLRSGGDEALEELVAFVYADLRRVATGMVRRESTGLTLRATDVVHEAYLRLFDHGNLAWDDRRHFFASAATAMRRVLIDHSRRGASAKRIPKGELMPIELGGDVEDESTPNLDVLALDQALRRLQEVDSRQAEIVELRYFAGLTAVEVAELLGISRGTVTREWRVAKLWLRREMRG